jgi:hypothetical protein
MGVGRAGCGPGGDGGGTGPRREGRQLSRNRALGQRRAADNQSRVRRLGSELALGLGLA